MRQYYIGVGVFRQLFGALVCFLAFLGCLAVVLEPTQHSIGVGALSILGIGVFGFLFIGALINACRVGAAKFRIFFWWGN